MAPMSVAFKTVLQPFIMTAPCSKLGQRSDHAGSGFGGPCSRLMPTKLICPLCCTLQR